MNPAEKYSAVGVDCDFELGSWPEVIDQTLIADLMSLEVYGWGEDDEPEQDSEEGH